MSAIRNASAAVVDEPARLSNVHAYAQQHESLDAAFALLDDVRAQSFALQLRLRNSLPVRWSSNALVMQRGSSAEQHAAWDVKRHAGAGTDVSRQRRVYNDTHRARRTDPPLEDSGSARDNLMLDEFDWNRQRYRRKIEWDVAKRIARVDRELTSLPPAQRFWNKKRTHEQQQQQLTRQKELSRTRAMEARVKVHDVTSEYGSATKKPVEKAVVISKKIPEARHSLSRVAPHDKENLEAKNAQLQYEKQTTTSRMSRPTERAPSRSTSDNSAEKRKPVDPHKEKENEPPKQPKLKQEAPAVDSVVSDCVPLSDSLLDPLTSNKQQLNTTNDQEQPASEEARSAVVTEAKPEDKLAREIFLDLNEPTMDVHSPTDSGAQATHQQHARPPLATSGHEQQPSSVGRQVLSDFRNSPSMTLYGPPAVTGDRRNRKLSSDVLRRLFSDLDSDRDGHLNRIETCMALHRLQIAVPATRIASFFRRVHAEVDKPDRNDRGNSNRAAVHQPLKELISYKQFVAFATAANDRQRLQQSRPQASHQQIIGTSTPLSTSRQRAASSIPPMQFSALISAPLNHSGNALYELVDTNEDEDQLEQKVLKSIPDYLLTRLLADEARQAESDSKKTASVVRKSLEKLLPRDSFDEKMVQEIARELIREHLQNRSLHHVKTDQKDSSGLGRAAAYFEKLSTSLLDLGEETREEGGEIEDLDSWLNLLTEEQVAALVQEILREKAPALLQSDRITEETKDSPSPMEPEADSLEPPTLERKPEPQSTDDKETDTRGFLSTHLQMVAEKEVQAGDAELEPVRVVLSEPPGKTAAARRRVPTISISILRQLRAERKRHRSVPVKLGSSPVIKARDSVDKRPSEVAQPQKVDRSVEAESMKSSSDSSADFTRHSNDEALEMNQSVASDAFPKLIKTNLFTGSITRQGNSFRVPSRSSSSASFSDLSSSGDSQISLFSDFVIATNTSLQASSTRRSRQKQKWFDPRASMSSSCRNSLVSEDLSEGEIERRASLDLSDGELVGKERKRVVMQTNAINQFFGERVADDDDDSGDELNDTKGSIESGELLPITKLRSTYRQRVLDLSFSSAESGELEDGLLG